MSIALSLLDTSGGSSSPASLSFVSRSQLCGGLGARADPQLDCAAHRRVGGCPLVTTQHLVLCFACTHLSSHRAASSRTVGGRFWRAAGTTTAGSCHEQCLFARCWAALSFVSSSCLLAVRSKATFFLQLFVWNVIVVVVSFRSSLSMPRLASPRGSWSQLPTGGWGFGCVVGDLRRTSWCCCSGSLCR